MYTNEEEGVSGADDDDNKKGESTVYTSDLSNKTELRNAGEEESNTKNIHK